jgi:hypothetical protein
MKFGRKMLESVCALLFITIVIGIAIDSIAGEQILMIDKPMKTRCLCGRVVVHGYDEGEEGVLVELCSPDWEKVISSTYTDSNGYFNFADASQKKMYYLRFSLHSFHTMCIKAKISSSEKKELRIVLEFA